jgi:predicted DNA-binding protein (MmcQ/YjbR family)
MDVESLREYCLDKAFVEEGFPFGPETLVFKIGGKIFLLIGLDSEDFRFNVKCHPDRIEQLRADYDCVQPGFHQNKKHWNTIIPDGSVSIRQLEQWIDESYDLVFEGLSKKMRDNLTKEQ